MRQLLCLTFLLLIFTSSAQTSAEQKAIDRDVWYNFMQAYQDLNASLFNQIHTDDVIRVPADQGTMMIGKEYKDANLNIFNRWNELRLKQKIEFSFLQRVQKADWAYEIGIYKLTRYNGSESQSHYGKFNVTLRKLNGIWKIYIDSDTSENQSVGAEDFEKGRVLK